MGTHNLISRRHARSQGFAIVYVVVAIVVMLGFCSLAVDLGRVQVTKTELRRAADAAARAGIANISSGASAVITAAQTVGAKNSANGLTVNIKSGDIQIGAWNANSKTFIVGGSTNPSGKIYPAVRVYTRCTQANGNPVGLMFASILGFKSCDVAASTVAALVSVQSTGATPLYVSANSNPWLSGEPAGTLGSQPDPGWLTAHNNPDHKWKYDVANPTDIGGTDPTPDAYGDPDYEPYASAPAYTLSVTPGSVVQISVPMDSNNMANNDGNNAPAYFANGSDNGYVAAYKDDAATDPSAPGYTGQTNGGISGSEHGMSNIDTPINSLVGVFLDNKVPDTEDSTVPAGLDFSTQSARDYTELEPELRQTFYAGTGQTSDGYQQTIVVPPNATRLFLGTMDGHEWSNNDGGFHVSITQLQIETVQ